MPDFAQHGPITTLHELGTVHPEQIEANLRSAVRRHPIGLLLPVTATDMRAEPFARIAQKLVSADYIDTTVVVLNRAESIDDYRECREIVSRIGPNASVLWTDGPRAAAALAELTEVGFDVSRPGKGRAVWTAFGYLLADPRLKAFVLQDCDIVNYDNEMLVRLCLPMAHASVDFEFAKAYYARVTDRMHGRVVRLLMTPLLRAMIAVLGSDPFLVFLRSFRYPLSGEFAISATLARSNRIPCDWGLEVGVLAEVFRNTSPKRVCQVDLGRLYEHKHQPLDRSDPDTGLLRMGSQIIQSILRTLASRGQVLSRGHLMTLQAAFLRLAQDAVRQYHADAMMNSLEYDRHSEEQAIEAFAALIATAGDAVLNDPTGAAALPTWSRVVAALPDFPSQLRKISEDDAAEYGV